MKMQHMLSAIALSLVASVAWAGFTQPVPVEIDFTNRWARGDMSTARNSANPFEYIGCGVRNFAGGSNFAFCQAGLGEATGQYLTCFTYDPLLIDAIKAIGDFSYVQFDWDADFNCTHVGISTQSFYLPDLKPKK
jgi:hypothetical protein